MAVAHPAHCADDCSRLPKPQLRLRGLLSLPPKWPMLAVIVLALGLAGCARNPARGDLSPVHRDFKRAQRHVSATPVRSYSPARVVHADTRKPAETQQPVEPPQPVELRVHRPDPALLAAQPAPNCEFKRADIKAVDGDEWARLKTEFERQCYLDAEKAVRDRLSQLQASSTCEVERVPVQRPAR